MNLNLKTIPISKIKPAKYNPRIDLQPEDERYQHIARSIETFGLVEPLVWNEHNGVLISGHQRLKVLKDMGRTEVDVSIVNYEDEKIEMALNIALNNVSGENDDRALRELLVKLDDGSFDLTAIGFDEKALKKMVDEAGDKAGLDYQKQHEIIVECRNETEQKKLYDELTDKGYACRVLTL